MGTGRRILAKRECTARISHRCDHCDGFIFPGDRYEITVELRYFTPWKWLRITKEHMYPPCPYPGPYDDIDDLYDEEDTPILMAA